MVNLVAIGNISGNKLLTSSAEVKEIFLVTALSAQKISVFITSSLADQLEILRCMLVEVE